MVEPFAHFCLIELQAYKISIGLALALQFFAIGYSEQCENHLDTKRFGWYILGKVTGRKPRPTRRSTGGRRLVFESPELP